MTHLTDTNMNSVIASGVTVVDFYADWCSPCRALAPTFEKTALSFSGRANFVKMDIESNPQSAINFGISSIPCVIVFKDGKIAAKHTGLINQKQLESLVSKHLEELATT